MHINLKECPLCSNTSSKLFLKTTDQTVSKESFTLVKCDNCSFVYTNPRPALKDMNYFYQSEAYISHADQSNNIFDSVYFLARQYMLRKKLNWLKQFTSSKDPLLDYGCGTGAFVNFLISKGWNAWGVEPNQHAREVAKKDSQLWIYDKLESIPLKKFQAITLWHVLEHLHHLEHDLNKLLSLLSDSGYLIIAVPNSNSFDAVYYGSDWAGYDVPRHLSHFTPETIKVLAKKHRLQLVKTFALKLDAYYISLLSEKYRDGSSINALYQAMKSNRLAKRNQSNYSSLVYVLQK